MLKGYLIYALGINFPSPLSHLLLYFPARPKNRGDMIRTCDLFAPNEALYQAELHPVWCLSGQPEERVDRREKGYHKGSLWTIGGAAAGVGLIR